MKHILSLLLLLVAAVSLRAQTVSNVQADFACPGGVTVTYATDVPVAPEDAVLYYSPDGGTTWLEAKTVTKTGNTIEWDNKADNVAFGQFKLKVEVPQNIECVEINGVCWATTNVDAPGTFAQYPEDAGMLYQWNRSVGWSAGDPMVNSTGGTTWDSSVPGGTEWEEANDPCPDGFRVPTLAELESLFNTGPTWTNKGGVGGFVFSNGSEDIFLPAVGARWTPNGEYTNTDVSGVWILGCYWSNVEADSNNAYFMLVDNQLGNPLPFFFPRANAQSVRCVKE